MVCGSVSDIKCGQQTNNNMNICIYGSASSEIDKTFKEETERLGFMLAQRGHNLVFGAGAHGLMGAAARGFKRGGGKIYGVAPSFMNADGLIYPDCTELFRTVTMRERKQKMDDLSDAFVSAPGGIGTYEELFEILTLKQLCQTKRALVMLNTNGYYEPLRAMLENGVQLGFMPSATMRLLEFRPTPESVIDYLENYTEPVYTMDEVRNVTKA